MSSNQIVFHNIYNAYMYNITIGIAQLNAFSRVKKLKTRKGGSILTQRLQKLFRG